MKDKAAPSPLITAFLFKIQTSFEPKVLLTRSFNSFKSEYIKCSFLMYFFFINEMGWQTPSHILLDRITYLPQHRKQDVKISIDLSEIRKIPALTKAIKLHVETTRATFNYRLLLALSIIHPNNSVLIHCECRTMTSVMHPIARHLASENYHSINNSVFPLPIGSTAGPWERW